MKKIKYIFPILMFCICLNVKAIDACTTEEMNRLNELAKNVQFKTSYELEPIKDGENTIDVRVLYKIQLMNDNNDLIYYYNTSSSSTKIETNFNDFLNIGFEDGEIINLYIYSYTENLCTDELLRTETIKLPIYNRFYYLNQDKCKEHPSFKYCKEFLDNKINYSKIEAEYEKFIKSEENNDKHSFFKDNLFYIIGAIIILIGIVSLIIYLIKRKKNLDI